MRLSLLRSPIDPDPHADEGRHEFTYSLYPHAWNWRNGTVQQGADLNTPLFAVEAANARGGQASAGAIASMDCDYILLDAVKKAEDSNDLVLRFYEAYGQRGETTITFDRKPKRVFECDLMEENGKRIAINGHSVALYFKPFEIRTLKVQF
jgi:alpha-mannosidase